MIVGYRRFLAWTRDRRLWASRWYIEAKATADAIDATLTDINERWDDAAAMAKLEATPPSLTPPKFPWEDGG